MTKAFTSKREKPGSYNTLKQMEKNSLEFFLSNQRLNIIFFYKRVLISKKAYQSAHEAFP